MLGMQNAWNACQHLAAFHSEVTAKLQPMGRRWQWVLCSHSTRQAYCRLLVMPHKKLQNIVLKLFIMKLNVGDVDSGTN